MIWAILRGHSVMYRMGVGQSVIYPRSSGAMIVDNTFEGRPIQIMFGPGAESKSN
jgi:hypothetical protein